MGRFGTSWENSRVKSMLRQGLMHQSGLPNSRTNRHLAEDRWRLFHPCFAMRFGGVSGGKETQGWRDSSHTAMVGAGKFGSAKLPMATATYPGKPSPSQYGGAACRTEMEGQRVATFGCPHPRRRFTGEGDLLAAEARLVADRGASAALALQAVAHGDAQWFALDRKVKLPATAGGASSGHGPAPWLSIWLSVGWTSKRCTMGSGPEHGRTIPLADMSSRFCCDARPGLLYLIH